MKMSVSGYTSAESVRQFHQGTTNMIYIRPSSQDEHKYLVTIELDDTFKTEPVYNAIVITRK